VSTSPFVRAALEDPPLARSAPRPPSRSPWTTRLAVVGTTFRRMGLGRLSELMFHPQDSAIARREAQRLLREERFKRIADDGARSLVGDRLGHLPDDDRDQVLRFALNLAGRLARQPG